MEELQVAATDLSVIDRGKEKNLETQVSKYEALASSVNITTDADFAYAGDLTKNVKALQKQVKEYWEPIYRPAYNAYKSINEHKKAMLDPLENAEKILKKKIASYTMEQERKRREQEETMRRLAREEMERKLEEAAKSEASGDAIGADFAMAEAEVLEGMSMTATVASNAPKHQGVSSSKTWHIVSIDDSAVPINYAGATLRPVDERAVLRLIKEMKGKIVIPGVKFEEDVTVSIRT